MGANLKCPICDQKSFFLPNELQNILTCRICRNTFHLPSYNPNEIRWAYSGIGPFSRNNRVGGLMTVFLCLRLFKREFADTFGALTTLTGFELKQKGKPDIEVDLAALLKRSVGRDDGAELLLCECKTFNKFEQLDFDRMKLLGDDFPGSTLVFATLNETFSDYEKKELIKLVTYFRKGNAQRPLNSILLLTRSELMPKEMFDALREYNNTLHAFHRYQGYLFNLSEMTIKKHLDIKTWGEIIEEEWQNNIKK
jgi:hypothetical protein